MVSKNEHAETDIFSFFLSLFFTLCGSSTVGIVAGQNRGWESTWERQFAQEGARERQHPGWKKSEQRTKKCGRGWYEKRRTCDAIPHKDRGEQRKKQWQSIFWSVEIFLETSRFLCEDGCANNLWDKVLSFKML